MDDVLVQAEAYIAEHYDDSSLCLTQICRHLGIGCSYFSTLFKQKTGQKYSHYLIGLRLERAAELLKNTDDTAISIGYQVGYSEPNYFSRAFKKRYGVPPSMYRSCSRRYDERILKSG